MGPLKPENGARDHSESGKHIAPAVDGLSIQGVAISCGGEGGRGRCCSGSPLSLAFLRYKSDCSQAASKLSTERLGQLQLPALWGILLDPDLGFEN